MWWKILSVILIFYAIAAGMLVPLKPGITHVSPETAKTGQIATLQLHGYNSFYTKSEASGIRVWLQYDSLNAVLGQNVKIVSDTMLEATFTFPPILPRLTSSVILNAIIEHPADGISLLPGAIEVVQDSSTRPLLVDSTGTITSGVLRARITTRGVVLYPDNDSLLALWTQNPVNQLYVIKDFTFPYRNVIYESIRNTYFHVPMWFALMFLFIASVVYSVRFLFTTKMDFDRKAAAYAETGLLFGILGLATGMLWAHYAWGAAWSNDIKQLMTAVALLIYLAYFILRASFDEPEKGARLAAVYNIFAFASLIPLLYIVPRMFASLHPGATGNPAFGSEDLDNTMRAVFYPAILGFTGLGFWMAELRIRYQRLADKALDLD